MSASCASGNDGGPTKLTCRQHAQGVAVHPDGYDGVPTVRLPYSVEVGDHASVIVGTIRRHAGEPEPLLGGPRLVREHMYLPAKVPERLLFDASEPGWRIGKHGVQDGHPQLDKRSSPRPRRESPEDFRRTLIRLHLQMPQGLNFLGCQIEDSRAQNALGPELKDPSKLLDRVGHVVCPDGEIEDDRAQNQFSVP